MLLFEGSIGQTSRQLAAIADLGDILHISTSYTGTEAVGENDAWYTVGFTTGDPANTYATYYANNDEPVLEGALLGFPADTEFYVVIFLDADHNERLDTDELYFVGGVEDGDGQLQPVVPVALESYESGAANAPYVFAITDGDMERYFVPVVQ